MSAKLHPKASALLDAHVAYLLDGLAPEALQPRFEAAISRFLEDVREIPLQRAVTATQVKQTARRYASEIQLGGAVPELVGDIARHLYRHKAHDKTMLAELLPDATVNELLEKTLELNKLYRSLVRESVTNPIYSEVISDLLYSGIRDFVTGLKFPGSDSAARVGRALRKRTRPELGEELEEKLRGFIKAGTQSRLRASEKHFLAAVESEEFRELLLEFWDEHKDHKLAGFRDYVSSRDIEEYFVIGYEYYQHLRKTRFFHAMLDAGIDAFYRKYGDVNLRDLIEEIGITPEMMLAEALQFAPPIIEMMRESGLLEEELRRGLQGFYESDVVGSIVRSIK